MSHKQAKLEREKLRKPEQESKLMAFFRDYYKKQREFDEMTFEIMNEVVYPGIFNYMKELVTCEGYYDED